jgi:hypothetical protein
MREHEILRWKKWNGLWREVEGAKEGKKRRGKARRSSEVFGNGMK